MNQSIYVAVSQQTMKEYESREDLIAFYRSYGCDGMEVIRCGEELGGMVSPDMVRGVHMGFYAYWLDFWRQDWKRLIEEFGSKETCVGFYGGEKPEALLSGFRRDLKFAQEMEAEYVVFHVSDVTVSEVFHRSFHHTDEEVVDGAAEVIHELLNGTDYSFYFLMENLQWPGLTMTRPEITQRLLSKISYPKKGIQLDLGHLMCTNPKLDDQRSCLSFVHEMLTAHGELCQWIKGVHMHQSHSGKRIRQAMEHPPIMEPEFYARFSQVYEFLRQVDTHSPMTCPGTRELIQRIDPLFLTHEFLGDNRRHLARLLKEQTACLAGL